MSETAEREMELVAGTIGGITQKKADTWTVAVTPEGSQYAKNLWTKSTALVEALQGKLGQQGAFVCNASYWSMADGKQVRSLWIESEADEDETISAATAANPSKRVATPAAAPRATINPETQSYAKPAAKTQDAMTKDEWAAKDRAADLRACIAIAAGALQHSVPSAPTDADLNDFARRALFVARQFHGVVTAERTGNMADDSVPF